MPSQDGGVQVGGSQVRGKAEVGEYWNQFRRTQAVVDGRPGVAVATVDVPAILAAEGVVSPLVVALERYVHTIDAVMEVAPDQGGNDMSVNGLAKVPETSTTGI